MLYRIAHILRDKMPWLWDAMGIVLSWLFGLRYGRKMEDVKNILHAYDDTDYRIVALTDEWVTALARMFAEQPEEAFAYFRPHGFEEKDLRKLVRDKGFLAYAVLHDKEVVGYFFQRCFFWGKSYRGYMTDYRWRRKGINKMMNQCANDISRNLGLKVFGTIAPENEASMLSAQKAGKVRIVEQLKNGDYYVEYEIR